MSDSETGSQLGNQPSPTGRTQSEESNLEMVNLSSQLKRMDLLSTRKGKKRVRFQIPDAEVRITSSQDFVSFQKISQRKQKKVRRVPSYLDNSLCLEPNVILGETLTGAVTRSRNLQAAIELANQKCCNKDSGDDEECSNAKRLRSESEDSLDDNNNCSNSSTKLYVRRKMMREGRVKKPEKKVVKCKKSATVRNTYLSKHKANLLKKKKVKAKPTQNKKEVNSKQVEISEFSKPGCSKVKTAKSNARVQKSDTKKKQKKAPCWKQGNANTNNPTSPSRASSVHKSHSTRVKSSKTKHRGRKTIVSSKSKLKASLVKSLKNKAEKKKLELKKRRQAQAKKRIANKKAALKKKMASAKQKKLPKEQDQNAKRSPLKRVRQTSKKPKKPKFIPIEREDEVCVPMRTNLLKFRTFQCADEKHWHCCSKKCWEYWDADLVDIEDVYIDYE